MKVQHAERDRKQRQADFQAQLKFALEHAAKRFDWSLVSATDDRDWKTKQETLLARYKDVTVILGGIASGCWAHSTPSMTILLLHSQRPNVKLLLVIHDLEQ